MLVTSRENGRFIPGQGILVHTSGGQELVRLEMHNFVWHQEDVQSIYPVGTYDAAALSRHYRCEGWGVPVVVQRCKRTGAYREESYFPSPLMFAATVLLRPSATGDECVLEFVDPLRSDDCGERTGCAAIARDISAPFAFAQATAPRSRGGWIPFVNPDSEMLRTISALPTSPAVHFHSIFGYGCGSLWEGPGDGAVSVASTHHAGDESQLGVSASHTQVHRKLETVAEIVRILQLHLDEMEVR